MRGAELGNRPEDRNAGAAPQAIGAHKPEQRSTREPGGAGRVHRVESTGGVEPVGDGVYDAACCVRRDARLFRTDMRESRVRSFLTPVSRRLALFTMLGAIAFGASAQIGSLIPQNPTAKSPDRDPRAQRAQTPDYRQYEYGKEIYAVKLGCPTCPLGDKPLDESVAKRFLADDELRLKLEAKEEEAVSVYLKQRFGLF